MDIINIQNNKNTSIEYQDNIIQPAMSNLIKSHNINPNSLFLYQESDKYPSIFNELPSSNYSNQNNSNLPSENSEDSYDSDNEVFISPTLKQLTKKRNSAQIIPSKFQGNFPFNDQIYPNNNTNHNNIYPLPIGNFNDIRRKSLNYPHSFNIINFPQFQKVNTINSFYSSSKRGSFSTKSSGSMKNFTNFPNNPVFISQPEGNNDIFILDNLNKLLFEQSGCRQVQNKLEEKKNEIDYMHQFFKQSEGLFLEVINNQFGNYAMQKLFDVLLYQKNKELITEFFIRIQKDLFIISVNPYGTRVFQKALEKLDNGIYETIETEALNKIIVQFIEKNIFPLCNDKNGNFVFQKIIKIFPKKKNDFIYHKLNKYALEISKLQQGDSIIRTAIIYANKTQKDELVSEILKHISSLINDQYGNYVIQNILDLKEKEYNMKIGKYVIENIVDLSKKKFSSNVIDKFIEETEILSLKIIKYIIEKKLVSEMITDQYGNYVIQKALNYTSGKDFMEIINQIKPCKEMLKKTNIGKKIYENLIQKYGNYFKDEQSYRLKNK